MHARKDDLTSIEISTQPGVAGAAKVKVGIKILEGLEETPRELIAWHKSVERTFVGLSCTTGTQQIAALPQFTQGFAWTTLEVKCHKATEVTRACEIKAKEVELEADDGTEADRINNEITAICARTEAQYLADVNTGHVIVTKVINALLTTLMPNKILQRVKRYLRHEARKPLDMKVKTYLLHINRINHEEIPELPPNYDTAQSLGSDEISDILLYGTPKSWQREMDCQGFDPMAKTTQEIVQFMENIDMSEDFDGDVKKKIGEAKKGNSKKAMKKNNNTSGQKFCLLHGNNNTHTTDECNMLKAQAKKLKGDTGRNVGKVKGKGKNKTWTNKSKDKTDKSKGKLTAFVKKAVKDGLKQELKSIDKKHKSNSDDSSMDLHAIDIEL